MRIKKNLVLNAQRVFYHLRSIRMLVFIPLFAFNILIPVLNYASYSNYGISELFELELRKFALILMPFFSVFWVIFVLREYIEGEGNEILLVYGRKIKFKDTFQIMLVSFFNISLIFAVYLLIYPRMLNLYLWIFILCVYFHGIVYLLSFLTSSTTITLMISLLVSFVNYNVVEKRTPFFSYAVVSGFVKGGIFYDLKTVFLPHILLALVLSITGMLINKNKVLSFE